MKFNTICIGIILGMLPMMSIADGNKRMESFSKAKRYLMKHVYNKSSERNTIYCNASFDDKKKVQLPAGFEVTKYVKRSKKVEFEHVVPAENFGRTFAEWRDGNPKCVDRKGKDFKNRKCAEKTNKDYRLMQSDMYNLYAAIGSVNALRLNYNFVMLEDEKSDFGSCDMQINNRKAQPPVTSRGVIARTYLYMDNTYKRYNMSNSQRKLMAVWDRKYPVTNAECRKGKIVEKIQGNVNRVLAQRCENYI